mmetsp:Transcript_833/g.1138  ORF Transcript_833/g.1138 Transcript_833/m.1138 type:complete len:590 (-) Transcript_833:30-1799(-)
MHLTAGQHLIFCDGGIDRFDVLFDRLQDFGVACQFLIRGVGNIVALGPIADCGEVDVDERNAAITAVAEQNGLQNVRIELQFVLDILRRKHGTICHLAHVLGAVDDPQMAAALFKETSIACCHPPFRIFGRSRGFRVVVVFNKCTGRAVVDLSALIDLNFDTRRRNANCVGTHFAIRLNSDENRRFCLAVQLFEVDAERAVELENLRANGLACGVTDADAAVAQRVLERAVNQDITQLVLQAIHHADGFAIKDLAANLLGMFKEVVEHLALQGARVFHPDHDAGQLALENPRRSKEIGRADLTQIGHHRVSALWAVHAEPTPIRLADRKDEIPDPRHRQIGQDVLTNRQIVKICRVPGALDHVAVGQNNPFGLARCPRGVEHHAGAVIGQLGLAFFEIRGPFVAGRTALILNMGILVQRMMIVFPHAARIEIDHLFQVAQLILNFDHLVDLFLITCDDETCATVAQHIGHLFCHRILIERDRNGADGLRCHHCPIKIGPVATDDGDKVTLVDPKVDQPKGKRINLLLDLGPGPALPDAEFFFAIGLAIAKLCRVAFKQRRQGQHPCGTRLRLSHVLSPPLSGRCDRSDR